MKEACVYLKIVLNYKVLIVGLAVHSLTNQALNETSCSNFISNMVSLKGDFES